MKTKILQTAERVSASNLSDNYVFQRSLLAYLILNKQVVLFYVFNNLESNHEIKITVRESRIRESISKQSFRQLCFSALPAGLPQSGGTRPRTGTGNRHR